MLPKKGVLVIGNFLSGIRRSRSVCEDLADTLAEAGWPVVTASCRVGRLPKLIDMMATTWKRRGDYQVAQVDVYSGPAFAWAEVVCAILRVARKPYILSLHGGALPEFAARRTTRVKRLLRSAYCVTTPSRYLAERMAPYRNDLVLLPNPLRLGDYHHREQIALRPRLIWLRAFHKIYNPALAPMVAARLAPGFPDVRLFMTGPDKQDGSWEQTVEAARRLGVGERVTLTRGIGKNEVPAYLSEGDIFLNTSNIDNTPVSVLEAMASGLCVVSTDVGGVRYLLEDGHDALLVPANDPAAMSDAIARLLREPALASRLSHNARRKAAQFDWSIIFPRWEALLSSARESQN